MSEKGISLPIRLLVIMVVVIIVLFTVLALYTGNVPGQGREITAQGTVTECCAEYVREGGCSGGVTAGDLSAGNCTMISNLNESCCAGVST